VLGLSDYEKVIFVDADMIHIASCDDLFDLNAPAATFSRREAEPYVTGTTGKMFANGKSKGVRNPYIKYLRHGDKIPYQVV
jgi:alpha-N-acetylglucosamine transferase